MLFSNRKNRKLDAGAAKFQSFLEGSPDAIVIVDKMGHITLVNMQAEQLFEYDRKELLGKAIEVLIPERFRGSHHNHRSMFLLDPKARGMGGGRDLLCLKKDGTEFPAEIALNPIETPSGILISSVIRDVTARRAAQKQLETSLKEKETLLRETHHRVKNNLQIISSLLSLQAEQAKDSETKQAFLESQSRVLTMALMHERLYQSKTVSDVNLKEYFQDLVRNVSRTYVLQHNRIQFELEIENSSLDPEKLIPLALIANELISNSLKHAFPAGRTGKIRVSFSVAAPEELRLMIQDDGVGFREGMDFRKTSSLGLKLVRGLTEQLKGKLELRPGVGTEFWITFPGALGG